MSSPSGHPRWHRRAAFVDASAYRDSVESGVLGDARDVKY